MAGPVSDTLVFDVPLVLANGRQLWLRRFEDRTPPASPEPVPAGQMVRVLNPETDNVVCPGFLLVGLNIG